MAMDLDTFILLNPICMVPQLVPPVHVPNRPSRWSSSCTPTHARLLAYAKLLLLLLLLACAAQTPPAVPLPLACSRCQPRCGQDCRIHTRSFRAERVRGTAGRKHREREERRCCQGRERGLEERGVVNPTGDNCGGGGE